MSHQYLKMHFVVSFYCAEAVCSVIVTRSNITFVSSGLRILPTMDRRKCWEGRHRNDDQLLESFYVRALCTR